VLSDFPDALYNYNVLRDYNTVIINNYGRFGDHILQFKIPMGIQKNSKFRDSLDMYCQKGLPALVYMFEHLYSKSTIT
jgi:hypothetical protein